jgi:inner membrane protein
MMFASHLVVAAAGFLTFKHATTGGEMGSWLELLLAGALVLTGAILPDIDHPQSRVGRALPFLSYPITLLLGHRGITHSLIMVVVLLILATTYEYEWLFWLTFGYLMHLVGDYLTDSGIPAFWPMQRRFRFVLVGSTNSISEPIIVLLFLAGCAAVWTI